MGGRTVGGWRPSPRPPHSPRQGPVLEPKLARGMDGQEAVPAPGLSWGQLSVKTAPHPLTPASSLKPSGLSGGSFRADLILYPDLLCDLAPWVYSFQDICK